MKFDYDSIRELSERNPAWRLLRADHGPLILAVLHRAFIKDNQRRVPAERLVAVLRDQIFAMGEAGERDYPRLAEDYLAEWSSPEKEWLRSYYPEGSNEQWFDMTPYSERAIEWLDGLDERTFVGQESRLLLVLNLLKEIAQGTEQEPGKRLEALRVQQEAIAEEIGRVLRGEAMLLEPSAVKDRFQQVQQTARAILADFRSVEHNFRKLDRSLRERIASFDGAKGELLADVFGERDAISDSDQGRSFRAFWEFLLSHDRKDELRDLLQHALEQPAVKEMGADPRIGRIVTDWITAGRETQRTVQGLSRQLRRFIDDRVYLDNRRITELLRSIEASALQLRSDPPKGDIIDLIVHGAKVSLTMDRPLHAPQLKSRIPEIIVDDDEDEHPDMTSLFNEVVLDTAAMRRNVRDLLDEYPQVSLEHVLRLHPLQYGLTELIGYLNLASTEFKFDVIEDTMDEVSWQYETDVDGELAVRKVRLPRLIFVRDQI